MDRIRTAAEYHKTGYNCCQSVLAVFTDRMGLSEETALRLGAGFGSGAGTGELCGALTGAIMALDLMLPDSDPVKGKRRAAARAKLLQQRFAERFDALRCRELLQNRKETRSPAIEALGITGHCPIMVATAVELAEEILSEEGA